ncbi:MAG: site-specific DNA-methyltransferase [Bacteroidetes bacterium HGW-Bacteroidetes-1]|jgi:adenine-specific DNA-methyltransferase|nr:MAG: site-specific DNA-methyltransferase [Bacteroidetes bacterium HGW-Bacteroidetes-1]
MPVKYIPYYPNTVEGQAILDNITRTQRVLRYRENNKVYDRIKRGMPYYEVEPLETVGEPSENLVIRGECISACAYLKEKGIKVDLVYIDPPFASGADYAKKVYLRKNPKLAEKVAAAEQEMDIDELKAFEEKMYGDIWQKEDYLNWMYENLMAIKSVMSDNASIYVHLDWNIGHYVKVLMDEVFGEDNFVNEITWHYYNKMAPSSKCFPRASDKIFLYCKSKDDFIFNRQTEEREQPVKQLVRKFVDGKAINARDDNGNVMYRDSFEKRIDDVWRMSMLQPADKTQPLNYSTQKPEALLQRMINASSNKGMLVADFFGGSGVTAKVANDLVRKFIHVDIGINSIQTVRDRLKEANANFQIFEIKDGVSLFRNPQQTMDKLAILIPGLQKGVKGISKFWFGAITKSKEGIVPVYVPNLLNTQEKVLDIPTINTIINQELQNLEVNAKKVIVYYIDIDDQKALEKFIKDNNATEIEVELKDLKNLLHDVVIEDIIEFTTTETKGVFTTEITKLISDRLIQKIGEFNQKGNLQSIKKGKKFDPINISNEGLELIELIALDCENTEGQWHSTTEIKMDKLGYVIKDGVKSKDFWDGKIRCETKPKRIKIRNISGDETIKVIE